MDTSASAALPPVCVVIRVPMVGSVTLDWNVIQKRLDTMRRNRRTRGSYD